MHRKIYKKRSFLEQKSIQNGTGLQNRRQTLPVRLPEAVFLDTGLFFIDFWLPAGPGWAPEWAPGRARDASNSAYIDAESQESSRPAPGRPQGAPRASPGTLLALFLDDC